MCWTVQPLFEIGRIGRVQQQPDLALLLPRSLTFSAPSTARFAGDVEPSFVMRRWQYAALRLPLVRPGRVEVSSVGQVL